MEARLQRDLAMLIDEADLRRIAAFPGMWTARENRDRDGRTYAVMEFRAAGRVVTIQAHRFMLSAAEGFETHYVNGDALDNRRGNLRAVSRSRHALAGQRARKDSKSEVRGVFLCSGGDKWGACVTIDGVRHYLGRFGSPEEAAAARERFLAERRLAKK